jgi:hypothetical protein
MKFQFFVCSVSLRGAKIEPIFDGEDQSILWEFLIALKTVRGLHIVPPSATHNPEQSLDLAHGASGRRYAGKQTNKDHQKDRCGECEQSWAAEADIAFIRGSS